MVGDDEIFRPREDLFDNVFASGAENFLRGIAGAIFPHVVTCHNQLLAICKNFYQLTQDTEYKSLQKYLNENGYNELQKNGIQNKYNDLVNGLQDKNYFKKHCIFIGLAHYPPLPGHYCLIVNTPILKIIDDIKFWVYPSDDPLYGKTFIYVPQIPLQDLTTISEKMVSFNRLIYPGCAIGV